MSIEKDILPEDVEGKWHGYCEQYYDHGELVCKGVYVNSRRYGYHEGYCLDGSIWKDYMGYFLDNVGVSEINESGDCYIWCKVVV